MLATKRIKKDKLLVDGLENEGENRIENSIESSGKNREVGSGRGEYLGEKDVKDGRKDVDVMSIDAFSKLCEEEMVKEA